jgi:D-beta-D-heptose 7-phosphate kinase/D-beta-D-heptose 1-phosphate adenosyltransferase
MARAHVVVVGDVMLDQFTIGRVTRISPEAPVPVVACERDEVRAGGAANVARNGRARGAPGGLVGLVGVGEPAARLRELLSVTGVASSGLITDEKRRTTTKVRIVTTRNQQVARVDYESDEAPSTPVEDALIQQLGDRLRQAGAIIVSDYLKGLITRRLMASVVAAAQAGGVPVLVDPKIPHLDHYAGATVVTPNHHEAEVATHMRIRTDEDAKQAAALFRERARCQGVLITRGEHGMWLSHGGVEGHLPATAREVADVTGAGDTVVATLALAMAAGATASEAAQLANEAAGIVVAKFGPATVSPAELLAAYPAAP